MDFPRDELLRLYLASCDEVHRFYESHNKRMEWLIGLVSAVCGAVGLGLMKSDEPLQFVVLSLGSLAIVGISRVARRAIRDDRQYFLEFTTVRSKYEQLLGLTTPMQMKCPPSTYWSEEPLVPSRYIVGRRAHAASEDWVKERLEAPDFKVLLYVLGLRGAKAKLKGGYDWKAPVFTIIEAFGWGLLMVCVVCLFR